MQTHINWPLNRFQISCKYWINGNKFNINSTQILLVCCIFVTHFLYVQTYFSGFKFTTQPKRISKKKPKGYKKYSLALIQWIFWLNRFTLISIRHRLVLIGPWRISIGLKSCIGWLIYGPEKVLTPIGGQYAQCIHHFIYSFSALRKVFFWKYSSYSSGIICGCYQSVIVFASQSTQLT